MLAGDQATVGGEGQAIAIAGGLTVDFQHAVGADLVYAISGDIAEQASGHWDARRGPRRIGIR